GLPDGATVTLGAGGNARPFRIFYNGGDGNDVILVNGAAPSTVYVNPAFAGTSPGTFIADADPVAPGSQPGIFQVNVFTTLQGAGTTTVIDATGLATGVHVTASNVTVTNLKVQGNNLTGQGIWIDAGGGSLTGDSVTSTTVTGVGTNIANDGIRVDRGATA